MGLRFERHAVDPPGARLDDDAAHAVGFHRVATRVLNPEVEPGGVNGVDPGHDGAGGVAVVHVADHDRRHERLGQLDPLAIGSGLDVDDLDLRARAEGHIEVEPIRVGVICSGDEQVCRDFGVGFVGVLDRRQTGRRGGHARAGGARIEGEGQGARIGQVLSQKDRVEGVTGRNCHGVNGIWAHGVRTGFGGQHVVAAVLGQVYALDLGETAAQIQRLHQAAELVVGALPVAIFVVSTVKGAGIHRVAQEVPVGIGRPVARVVGVAAAERLIGVGEVVAVGVGTRSLPQTRLTRISQDLVIAVGLRGVAHVGTVVTGITEIVVDGRLADVVEPRVAIGAGPADRGQVGASALARLTGSPARNAERRAVDPIKGAIHGAQTDPRVGPRGHHEILLRHRLEHGQSTTQSFAMRLGLLKGQPEIVVAEQVGALAIHQRRTTEILLAGARVEAGETGVRLELVGVGHVGAVVDGVAHPVGVGVSGDAVALLRIAPTEHFDFTDEAIVIFVAIIAGITGVADAICVDVGLIGVGQGRAVVAGVGPAVPRPHFAKIGQLRVTARVGPVSIDPEVRAQAIRAVRLPSVPGREIHRRTVGPRVDAVAVAIVEAHPRVYPAAEDAPDPCVLVGIIHGGEVAALGDAEILALLPPEPIPRQAEQIESVVAPLPCAAGLGQAALGVADAILVTVHGLVIGIVEVGLAQKLGLVADAISVTVVTRVAQGVAVEITLTRVGGIDAVITRIGPAILVGVGRAGVGDLVADVAFIADAIPILILLLFILLADAVVAGVSPVIVVVIALIGVGGVNAVVEGVAHAIAVGVGRLALGIVGIGPARALLRIGVAILVTVVAGITHAVLISVRLLGVGHVTAVVYGIAASVAVTIGRHASGIEGCAAADELGLITGAVPIAVAVADLGTVGIEAVQSPVVVIVGQITTPFVGRLRLDDDVVGTDGIPLIKGRGHQHEHLARLDGQIRQAAEVGIDVVIVGVHAVRVALGIEREAVDNEVAVVDPARKNGQPLPDRGLIDDLEGLVRVQLGIGITAFPLQKPARIGGIDVARQIDGAPRQRDGHRHVARQGRAIARAAADRAVAALIGVLAGRTHAALETGALAVEAIHLTVTIIADAVVTDLLTRDIGLHVGL